MREAKYRYTLIENNSVCCISHLTNDNRRDHVYRCIGCGREMKANLCTKKISYFSHKELCDCNGETYLHRLAKLKIKEKFDTSKTFKISFPTFTSCSNTKCPYYREECTDIIEIVTVDLKQLYDVCKIEEEVIYNGQRFIGDLVLTNSEKPNRIPLLIEIFNTHESTEKKKNSGLKIVEIEVGDESFIEKLFSCACINVDETNVRVFGFNQNYLKELDKKIPRFYHVEGEEPSFEMISCKKRKDILRDDSDVEINIPVFAYKYDDFDKTDLVSKDFMDKICSIFSIRECSLCEFYYQHESGSRVYHGCSGRFHGILLDEEMPKDIENCFHRKKEANHYPHELLDNIEIIKNQKKKERYFNVVISATKEFYNNDFLIEKCTELLKNKLEKEKVRILVGVYGYAGGQSGAMSSLNLSEELGISMEIYHADWNKHGKRAGHILNNQLISRADALIYFWNGKESDPRYIVNLAKAKNIPTRIINYGIEENFCPICGGMMITRYSKRGYFLGCCNYPECRGTRPVNNSI